MSFAWIRLDLFGFAWIVAMAGPPHWHLLCTTLPLFLNGMAYQSWQELGNPILFTVGGLLGTDGMCIAIENISLGLSSWCNFAERNVCTPSPYEYWGDLQFRPHWGTHAIFAQAL